MSLRGRHNFLQLSREGSRTEKSFRYQFDKPFDWLDFNSKLVQAHCSNEIILGFDPSFIRKSGKNSHGIGQFYSGCQGRYAKGLEVGSFAALDVAQHTAYHIEAVQSPSAKRDRIDESHTLVDHYAQVIIERAAQLQKLSNVIVCDAYFSKRKFLDKVCKDPGFEIISRLRDDANLNYLFIGKQSKGRGRKRKYAGKVVNKKIDKRRIRFVTEDENMVIHTAIVYSVGLKRNIRIAYVEHKLKAKRLMKLYYSTNLERDAKQLVEYYKLRFQMEFIFRDAKQYTGLEQCQSRGKNKLHFHFNASLTAVSIAKVIARNNKKNDERMPVSVFDIKTEFQNRNMIHRIFSMYGFSQKMIKINDTYKAILNFGKIAA